MREHPRAVEQEVRELLVRAGPRPAVPAADAAAITAAAREEWRRLVEERRRRRRLGGGLALAASVLLALVAGWWWGFRAAPEAPLVIARVERLTGEVRASEPEGEAAGLALGSPLAAGAVIETAGWGGEAPARLALALDRGRSLRLDAGTRVRLIGGERLELERGAVYYDSGGAAAAGGTMEVVTALGTVRDVGTQFEVRASAGETAVRVRVREGEAALDGAGGPHLVARGEQLSLQRDGSLVRAAVEPYGPEWEWVVAAAPVPEIEGRSLAEFLDWYGRESGRRIRWADPSLAEAAPTIDLYGTVADQTADEALTTLLGASGLAHEVEDGTVLIHAR